MKRFITLDKEEYRILQKYLQLNAKDTGGAGSHG
jgi:trimethylamine-N-oxide reductase cytochrome c-type subunit TorC